MAEKKIDRRALKTQKQIKEALTELLTQKELRSITIQELCDKADIHRVTFYKHFEDIYDLYDQMKKEILSELGLLILRFHENPSKDFGKEMIDYIENNPKVFKMIFSPHNISSLRHQFMNMIEGVFRLIQTEKQTAELKDEKLEYISAFWSSGCIAVIEKWVHNDCSQSKEYIMQMLSHLDVLIEKALAIEL